MACYLLSTLSITVNTTDGTNSADGIRKHCTFLQSPASQPIRNSRQPIAELEVVQLAVSALDFSGISHKMLDKQGSLITMFA